MSGQIIILAYWQPSDCISDGTVSVTFCNLVNFQENMLVKINTYSPWVMHKSTMYLYLAVSIVGTMISEIFFASLISAGGFGVTVFQWSHEPLP